jgi:hypothetical protein
MPKDVVDTIWRTLVAVGAVVQAPRPKSAAESASVESLMYG